MLVRLAIILISSTSLIFADQFNEFINNYNKKYKTEEKNYRKSVYNNNMLMIKKHNSEYNKGRQTFKMAVNQFTDMTYEEIIDHHTGLKPDFSNNLLNKKVFNYNPHQYSSKSVDWRLRGLVTEVKNQGKCGSCWAFGVIGCLEGQYAKKFGRLISFSEQQLLDCNFNLTTGNRGCNGGIKEVAFDYVTSNGVMSSASYPYTAVRGECQYSRSKVVAKFKHYVTIPVNEDALKQAVANIGPISVSIFVNKEFASYSGGVFSTTSCRTDITNHAVLIVGYGTDTKTGLDYWLIKNSWGTSWGEQGYGKMRRNFNNMCAIASKGLYALAAKSQNYY